MNSILNATIKFIVIILTVIIVENPAAVGEWMAERDIAYEAIWSEWLADNDEYYID